MPLTGHRFRYSLVHVLDAAALAWELAQSPVVIPIPGAKRASSITDSAAAADLQITGGQLARLDQDR